jgi:hypothetical protein
MQATALAWIMADCPFHIPNLKAGKQATAQGSRLFGALQDQARRTEVALKSFKTRFCYAAETYEHTFPLLS